MRNISCRLLQHILVGKKWHTSWPWPADAQMYSCARPVQVKISVNTQDQSTTQHIFSKANTTSYSAWFYIHVTQLACQKIFHIKIGWPDVPFLTGLSLFSESRPVSREKCKRDAKVLSFKKASRFLARSYVVEFIRVFKPHSWVFVWKGFEIFVK